MKQIIDACAAGYKEAQEPFVLGESSNSFMEYYNKTYGAKIDPVIDTSAEAE